ncbi:D-3-phosphoglycerate dehydrogenase [Hondaea fermentalgiana]|uniref:D-3-phosphoglycerate dehydrogenase n=1 Tax=Hondaea fermentalgiana TaxID=2315210 RepID=A0A2R5GXD4_9STRA|nr:D-3-phosphoglycerate dehydrogenase [Hondaea fermentalgiana]|eukprot:GBG33353.1 D-3-phosphoglycerate dehydrogenase [Hondaea fermentalgiana]
MDGLASRSANVRSASARELARFLGEANRAQEFLYYEGMKLVPKLNAGVERLLTMTREQVGYDEGAVAACLAVAKVYSHEDEWDGLQEMNIDLDPLVPSPQCLLEIARAAAGPAAAGRVEGLDDIEQDGKAGKAAAASAKRKKRALQSRKPTREVLITDEAMLRGLGEGNGEGTSIQSQWPRGVGIRDAALLALLKLCKLHKLYLQTRRAGKAGRVAAQATYFQKVVRVVREALLDELRKATSEPVMRADGSVAASASPLLAWRLGAWASIAEAYSSVMVLAAAFEAKDHDVFMEHVMRASRGILASYVAKSPWAEAALSPLLRVATNLTHENAAGCEAMNDKGLQLAVDMFKQLTALGAFGNNKKKSKGSDADDLLLGMDIDVEETEPDARSQFLFDSRLTLLGLLTNCVETNSQNRVWLSDHCSAFVNFFVSFLPSEALAKLRRGAGAEARIEFGWTAEDLITCSYACLLLGCLMRENKANQRGIKMLLPGNSLAIVMQVLEAFITFQRDARVLSEEAKTKTQEIMAELRGAELAESAASSTAAAGAAPVLVSRSGADAIKEEDGGGSEKAGKTEKPKVKRPGGVVFDDSANDKKKQRRKVVIVEDSSQAQRSRANREVMKRKDVVADEKIEFIVEESAQDLVAKHDKEELAQIGAILLAPVAPTEGLDALLEPGAALANVKWIHSYNVGVDHMTGLLTGTLSTTRADISVSNGRGAFSSALAEYAMLACLHFTKRVSRCQQNKRDKRYDRFTMPVLKDKTIGFVGFGHIAKSTARIAKDGFGMRVAAFRRNPDKEDSALADNVYTDKLELARKSDYIVCSLPGTPATIRFCDEAFFDAMQEGAVFISCGRGVVVDEAALAKQLRAERIFAALDVYEQEPLSESSELWDVPDDRVLMTAHNADLTEDFCQLGWETFRKNLHRFRAGEPLETPVDKAHGY